jgi:hypothetical protein
MQSNRLILVCAFAALALCAAPYGCSGRVVTNASEAGSRGWSDGSGNGGHIAGSAGVADGHIYGDGKTAYSDGYFCCSDGRDSYGDGSEFSNDGRGSDGDGDSQGDGWNQGDGWSQGDGWNQGDGWDNADGQTAGDGWNDLEGHADGFSG